VDCFTDPDVCAASADVARHGLIYLSVGRLRIGSKQGRRRHYLSRLTVAALNDFLLEPGGLDFRPDFRFADAFDRRDFLAINHVHRRLTRSDSHTVNVDSTGAALGNAASVFGACHSEDVTKHPKKWHVVRGIDLVGYAIDNEAFHVSAPLVPDYWTVSVFR
jgi:hypothetical protein